MSLLCFSRTSERMGLDLTAFPKSVVFIKIFKSMTEIQSCNLQLLVRNTSMALTRVLHLSPLPWAYRSLLRCSIQRHITALACFSVSLIHCSIVGSLCLSSKRNGTLYRNRVSQPHSCPSRAVQQLKQAPALSPQPQSCKCSGVPI